MSTAGDGLAVARNAARRVTTAPFSPLACRFRIARRNGFGSQRRVTGGRLFGTGRIRQTLGNRMGDFLLVEARWPSLACRRTERAGYEARRRWPGGSWPPGERLIQS